MMDMQIYFPNLGIFLENVGKSFSLFGFEVAFYGCTMALGIILGYLLAVNEAKRTGQNPENYLDLVMYGVVFAIIGARLYYVAFRWDYYKEDLLRIFKLRQGGLAIYGGIIAAFLTAYVFARKRKLNYFQILDTVSFGLLIGQITGRWGNFFNREAFGDYTDGLFAMRLPVDAIRYSEITSKMVEHMEAGANYVQVHPTFLYESMWNIGVLALMLLLWKKKHFDGEMTLLYFAGYGIGRFFIESLRTDQLQIGNTGIAVSQMLGIMLFFTSVVVESVVLIKKRKKK